MARLIDSPRRIAALRYWPVLMALCTATAMADGAIDQIANDLHELRTGDAQDGNLPDNSDRALRNKRQLEDDLYARLLALDADALSGLDLVTFKMLRETLEGDRGVRICQRELWNVDHIGGWHIRLGALAERQLVGSAQARSNALAQWRQLPAYVDVEIARLEAGIKLGYSAPQSVVKRVIAQVHALEATPPERSPLLAPLRRDDDPRFAADLKTLIAHEVYPALRRYREFLQEVYLPQARSSVAIASLPNGNACYRALLRRETTLDSAPQEIFERGQKMIETNRAAIVELGRTVFGSSDFDVILRHLSQDAQNKFSSAADVLEFSRRSAERARELSAPLFFSPPQADLQIVAFPEYQRKSGMNPYYSPAKPTGEPARYLINLETWQDNSKGQAEVATVHEAWPGHHLQVSVAQSIASRNRFAPNAAYGAYVEGWARYAERLADETGIYTTPHARIVWRAKPGFGMVVDPGLHVFGWTPERAAAFLKSSGLFTSDQAIADMIDRIAVMPAQLTAYDAGASEFLQLREQARRELGQAFDLREFHRQVLAVGFVPLSTLRELTTAWIERERGP